jgi:hypothetical protein
LNLDTASNYDIPPSAIHAGHHVLWCRP